MENLLTTKMSSRGQVVIPDALRHLYGWGNGTSFSVLVYKGSVIMQPLMMPSKNDLAARFDAALSECRAQAREAGMKPSDITRVIRSVRASHHARRVAA